MAGSSKRLNLSKSFEEHLQSVMEEQKDVQITSTLSEDTEMWQIGSRRPPRVCLCCGIRFDNDLHQVKGPYANMPYIYVCKNCWATPYLFFPDKVLADDGESWIPPEE